MIRICCTKLNSEQIAQDMSLLIFFLRNRVSEVEECDYKGCLIVASTVWLITFRILVISPLHKLIRIVAVPE